MPPPLVVHILYHFAVGGLENGLINLINQMPKERYRHAIISLKKPTDFRHRLQRTNIPIYSLDKKDGHDVWMYGRLWKILRSLRPSIIHTRNFGTLEFAILAFFSGVPGRVHGEHGRDVNDLDGTNVKNVILRKIARPFIQRYITVSADLAQWLIYGIKIPEEKVSHISNGVDVHRFTPMKACESFVSGWPFADSKGYVIIGSVGRIQAVKNHIVLVHAFLNLLDKWPEARLQLRLVIVGDGPLRSALLELLEQAEASHLAWLPGERSDVPEIMRKFDLFILPSMAEGHSNTISEAMATGLPVIASAVGGNPELVKDGETGVLVPVNDSIALSQAIQSYLRCPELLKQHGDAGRKRAENCFSMEKMVTDYMQVYDSIMMQSIV